MTRIISHCFGCAHYNRKESVMDKNTCKAFPEGIPRDLFYGPWHTTPYPGDNGILFEPKVQPKKPIARKVTVTMPKV